jgi:hypothetical protein
MALTLGVVQGYRSNDKWSDCWCNDLEVAQGYASNATWKCFFIVGPQQLCKQKLPLEVLVYPVIFLA